MSETSKEIIIEGLTRAGKPFRPSDWVDRMCSTYASFGADRKLKYSPYLKPRVVNGVRCLAVDLKLKDINPEGYTQLMHFATENNLNVLDENGVSIDTPSWDYLALRKSLPMQAFLLAWWRHWHRLIGTRRDQRLKRLFGKATSFDFHQLTLRVVNQAGG